MKLKFKTFSSSQQLVDFINNNRLTKDTIQKIESALSFEDEKTLAREYLTEQEEQLLTLFKSLSKRGKKLALEWMHALELYENS